jgi:hypothetical protein
MNNYTIVDLFEEKDVLNHPVSRILSKYFCKDVMFIILNYSNPEPEETTVVPKKNYLVWEITPTVSLTHPAPLISNKTTFPIIVYCDTDLEEDKDKEIVVGYIDVEANIGFGCYKLIPKKYKVYNTFMSRYDIPNNGNLDIIWMKGRTKYLNGFNISSDPLFYDLGADFVYSDKEGKNIIEFDSKNYCNAFETKNVYADFNSYYSFENFIIYPVIFYYLSHHGKEIEDLNYAISISMYESHMDNSHDIIVDMENIIKDVEIKFGKEKLRNFKCPDYKNNVILYEFCTDVTHYTKNFLYQKGKLNECGKKCNEKYKFFWCGIEFINKSPMILGNFCTMCLFDLFERSFFLSGECG